MRALIFPRASSRRCSVGSVSSNRTRVFSSISTLPIEPTAICALEFPSVSNHSPTASFPLFAIPSFPIVGFPSSVVTCQKGFPFPTAGLDRLLYNHHEPKLEISTTTAAAATFICHDQPPFLTRLICVICGFASRGSSSLQRRSGAVSCGSCSASFIPSLISSNLVRHLVHEIICSANCFDSSFDSSP